MRRHLDQRQLFDERLVFQDVVAGRGELFEEVLFEGGDEPEGDAKPLSSTDKKQAKYADDINGFKEGMDKEKLNQGIARDRGVTDCLCGVLFLGFAATMLVLLFWTISQGQTELLFAPVSFVNQTTT